MKPSSIHAVLDLAYKINKMGKMYNPMFVGPAGVGKSEIVQAWCKLHNLPFFDLRAAYLEAPDVNGFPIVREVAGRQVLHYATPDHFPYDEASEGVLFLDEVNRGNTSVMNAFMQLLTDRRIHNYKLPKGWFVVSAVNPETAENDVNTMDTAFRNRFVTYDVGFDKVSFIDYMKDSNWDKSLVQWVESGLWQYSKPEDIGNKPGDQYISPRDLSKLNSVLLAGITSNEEMLHYEGILGKNQAANFWKFKNDERPVTYHEITTNKKKAFARLAAFSATDSHKNAMISLTIQSIAEEGTDISDDLLADVLLIIPADQGNPLIKAVQFKRKELGKADDGLLDRMFKNKEVYKYLKDHLKSNA